MLFVRERLLDEGKQKEAQMDTHSTSQTQDTVTQKPTGCCGGKVGAQPQAKAEPRVAEIAEVKPAKSGCCCGQN